MILPVRISLAFLILACSGVAGAQITLNKSDVDAAYKFNTWSTFHTSGGPGPIVSLGLGSPSGSPQSFDFSSIIPDVTVSHDTSVSSYIAPTGEWHATDFPAATACTKSVQTSALGPYLLTYTFLEYYASENDGLSILGFVTRQQIDPPLTGFPTDTTTVSTFMPKSLYIPLPATYGTTRAAGDSLIDAPGGIQYHARTFDADGFGNVKYPDGVTRSSLRVSYTVTSDRYQDGSPESHLYEHHIAFVAQDLTQLDFEVDSAFAGGTANVISYSFSKQGGTVGVKDGAAPTGFTLQQNYPNPFNPSTHIDFTLASREHVKLEIYDILGREAATLVDGELPPGSYRKTWSAAGMAGGVYYYVLTTKSRREVRAMLLTK